MKTFLTLILATFCFSAFSQSNFHTLSLGAGGGLTTSYGDLQEHNVGQAIYGTADYLFTPFISLGLEVQNGTIKGGQYKPDIYGRQFRNNFRSLNINAKVQLGAFVNYNHSQFLNYAKGFYLSAGVGAIQHKVKELERRIPGATPAVYVPESKEVFIPLSAGYNYYIPNKRGQYRYVLNLNYQTNVLLGEGMDGYDTSVIPFTETKPDVFTYLTIGIKYNFGPMGVSQKTFLRY